MSLENKSTPALSETVAKTADVSAKEFEGMTRQQLIERLMALEQEKRAQRFEATAGSSGGQTTRQPQAETEIKSETSTNMDDDDEEGPSTPSDQDRPMEEAERSLSIGSGTKEDNEEAEEEDEEDETESEQQQQEATSKPMQCLWKECGQICAGMQELITHISDTHVGSGKVR